MDILLAIILVLGIAAKIRNGWKGKEREETENPWNQPWEKRLWEKRTWESDTRATRDTTWE